MQSWTVSWAATGHPEQLLQDAIYQHQALGTQLSNERKRTKMLSLHPVLTIVIRIFSLQEIFFAQFSRFYDY